jgi:hypothetical protein
LGKQTIGLQFKTRSLPCLTKLHFLFYLNGVKVIPHNIYELLSPVALAHMIMGDGSAQPPSPASPSPAYLQGRAGEDGLVICTDSFSVPEVVRLMNVLIIRYRLDCRLRFHTPTQPRISIHQSSMKRLRQIVEPFMHPSMMYKIER